MTPKKFFKILIIMIIFLFVFAILNPFRDCVEFIPLIKTISDYKYSYNVYCIDQKCAYIYNGNRCFMFPYIKNNMSYIITIELKYLLGNLFACFLFIFIIFFFVHAFVKLPLTQNKYDNITQFINDNNYRYLYGRYPWEHVIC
ncbi:hypothetical protein QLL95_gp0503 [Cotonvirus japonicus]|uniref:Uncharacterized protein n=1 Tax=Cotonvirus japonicus TaxID=2811091 RepID=A0ABM7NTW7_9VIRU|nr:hypothetical protein QLL95_gp0503 [Cotonvirus japonicus]BCS83620.1 hypothetical protein [Cotonvirus japonicus]